MEDFVDIDLGIDGKPIAQANDLVALIDADTLAYIACVNTEVQESLLPRDMYTNDEWEEIINNPYYDANNACIWTINLDLAYDKALEKINKIYEKTGCRTCELHFTGGRENFRYQVKADYKGNRTNFRAPTGLKELKEKLLANHDGSLCTKFEADDIVVYKKISNPDKYIMVAVDKDLLYSVPGRHFNYYESSKHDIDMTWLSVDEQTALRWAYVQCLVGDKTDNIEGIKGVGPAKAEKILAGCITHNDCWEAVVNAFDQAGKNMMEAIETMRLVNMYQLEEIDNQLQIKLWRP
jgi:DNA polymerase-1